ncbi:MAG: phosphodiester glycosidase family protein [Lachnospiraceae bacterium]
MSAPKNNTKKRKKRVPIPVLLVTDLLIAALYVGSFYQLNYRTERTLTSAGIVIENTTSTSTTSTESTATTVASATDTTASSDTVATDVTSTDSSDSAAETTASSADWSEKFAEYFTDEVVSTDTTYSSSNISITVTQYTQGSGSDIITYYVADIYVADIECLQTGFADDTYGVGYTDSVLGMDEDLSALLAINGDYYGNGSDGVVIRNGVVYRDTVNGSDVCVLYYDGTMVTYSADEFDIDEAIANGAWQAWSFGPELLDESSGSMTEFTSDGHMASVNPRTAIGYYEPGHYCFVVVDGRQSGYSEGMTLTQLSALMEELGCTTAYNLDGGKSSEMTFNDTYVNQPASGGREVSDAVIITEVE